MEQMLPSSVNYLDVLPRAVPSEKTRKRFFSSNGRTFSPNQTIKINLESTRSFLDPSNCYLEFNFQNTTGQTFSPDLGGAYNFIKNFRIHQAGNEICRVNNVNRLMAGIIVPSTNSMGIAGNDSIVGFQPYGNAPGAGNLNNPIAAGVTDGAILLNSAFSAVNDYANGATLKFTMPLLFSLFSQSGNGAAKLLPLPLLNHPIELYFDLCGLDEPGIFGAPPANWEIDDVSVIADLVEVPRDVIGFMKELQMMHGGSLAIQGQSYEHQTGDIQPQVGNQVINIPSRKKSIKSVLFVSKSNNYPVGAGADNNTFSLSYSGQSSIGSFFLRAGALVMPQPAVVCTGNNNLANAAENKRAEQFMELKKALGRFGSSIGTGNLSRLSYGVLDGDNSDGMGGKQSPGSQDVIAVCPFGLSLDAYQNEAVRAGLDTQTLSLELQLHLDIVDTGGAGIQQEVHNVDVFTLYDVQYYINADGTITFED